MHCSLANITGPQSGGIEVAINYKHDAFLFGMAVPDIERGQMAEIKPYFWQTDTAIALNSWGYTEDNDYRPAEDILCDLCDIVSKNGTLLLNVGHKSDGTIGPEDQAVLTKIGGWMAVIVPTYGRPSVKAPPKRKTGTSSTPSRRTLPARISALLPRGTSFMPSP